MLEKNKIYCMDCLEGIKKLSPGSIDLILMDPPYGLNKEDTKIKKSNKDIFVDTPGRKIEPEEGYINHPTPKPTKFIKELLEMFSKDGDLVLDPFIGSGSTAVACQDINRNFIGFEINKEYCELANKRLKVKKKRIMEF